jgi:hypothetical protein
MWSKRKVSAAGDYVFHAGRIATSSAEGGPSFAITEPFG